jgi:hypothetical protein
LFLHFLIGLWIDEGEAGAVGSVAVERKVPVDDDEVDSVEVASSESVEAVVLSSLRIMEPSPVGFGTSKEVEVVTVVAAELEGVAVAAVLAWLRMGPGAVGNSNGEVAALLVEVTVGVEEVVGMEVVVVTGSAA